MSTDADKERALLRGKFRADFAKVEDLAERAIADLKVVGGDATREYLLSLGYWLRCIESCQAAFVLIERGFPTAPMPQLRTAYECLFYSCALWRKPAFAAELKAAHDGERIRQANTMLKAGVTVGLPAERAALLQTIANEPLPATKGATAWEAAGAAGLIPEYETAYRGFGIGGGHASLRSLDDFYSEHDDGSFTLGLEPSSRQTAFLLSTISSCLACGIARHKEAISAQP